MNPPSIPSAPVVAAFDFDGTLTRGDTLRPFLRRGLGLARWLWVLLLCSPWLAAYALRLTSNHRAKARLLRVSLRGWSMEKAQAEALDFVTHALPGLWHPWGLAELVQHRRQGHRCILVSASPGVYLHAVGASLGMETVLCTELEVSKGRYTGNMLTANCHGEEKARRLRAWLEREYGSGPAPRLYAYGDTRGDKPMLRMADAAWYRARPWRKS